MPYDYLITLEHNAYTISRDGFFKHYYIENGVAMKENSDGEIMKATIGKYTSSECSSNLEYQAYKIVGGLSRAIFDEKETLMDDKVMELFLQLIMDDQNNIGSDWFPKGKHISIMEEEGRYILFVDGEKYPIEQELNVRNLFF